MLKGLIFLSIILFVDCDNQEPISRTTDGRQHLVLVFPVLALRYSYWTLNGEVVGHQDTMQRKSNYDVGFLLNAAGITRDQNYYIQEIKDAIAVRVDKKFVLECEFTVVLGLVHQYFRKVRLCFDEESTELDNCNFIDYEAECNREETVHYEPNSNH